MTIGIIGGAGVAATNKLCEIIETQLTMESAYRDEHHPEMIIYQATKVPSRSMYIEGLGPSFIDGFVDIGKKLKGAGADIIAMCCNTAHYAIEEIEKQTELPFINLIKEVALETKKRNCQKIGLIATNGSIKGKVYEKYFNLFYPEATLIYPDFEFQQKVTRGICNIKNENRFLADSHPDRPKNIFASIHNHLKKKGSDIVVVGCTDIRVDYQNDDTIDSLEVLAKTIINYTIDGK